MVKYTPNEVNEARTYFKEIGSCEESANLAGRRFSFFHLLPELNPDLKNFAFVSDGTKDNYVIGVSRDVPNEFKPFWAFHEYVEYLELGRNVPDRCINSLEQELKIIPVEFKPLYQTLRTQFFRDLVKYAERSDSGITQDIEEFRKSLIKLEGLR